STLGNPIADLAYFCMGLRLPSDSAQPGLGGLDVKSLGIPDEREIVAQYCQLRGIDDIPNWDFYLVFSYFRLASICQGVYKRALQGNASNEKALEVGKTVHALAHMAVDLI
ncbi:MAG: phosphotransferase family protein, partial [Pseudomonadales bacterium]|nr:phosphotransferase family protein [Pseudomonadales bacterium]